MSFELEAAIKRSGGRISKQRKELIHLLARSSEQLDADSLYQLAQQKEPRISLATVYRTLATLADAGIMQRRYLSPEHERQYFERNPDKEMIHIICRQCHHSYTVAGDLLAQFKEAVVAQQAWQDLTICSCMSGLCPDCFAKSQTTEGVE